MSEVLDFRALLNTKLAAMAQEISELFDQMIAQHEREIRMLKQSSRYHQLLDSVLKPNVVLRRADVQTLFLCQVKDSPHLDKETVHHLKEEQVEVSIKEEQEELQVSEHSAVSVISEDKEYKPIAVSSNSPQKHNTDERHCLRSEKQTPHSGSIKLTDHSVCEAVTEITNKTRTSLDSVSEQSDSDYSETETSDEWIPESPRINSLKTKSSLNSSTRKQNKSVSDEGSEVIFECTQCLKTFLRRTCSVRSAPESITCCAACSAAKLKQGNSLPCVTVHGRDKSFICSICEKGFSRPDNLSSHMLIHKGERPYSCKVCKKSFTEPGHLKAHARIHTGEKPFSCSVCKKGFTDRATRNRHERNHQGERPFSCSKCEVSFKQKAHYLSHLVVHSGERPFSCPVCKKTYTRNSHVTSHMKKAHAK